MMVRFQPQSNGRQTVRKQVDKQKMNWCKRHWKIHQRSCNHYQDRRKISGKKELYSLFDIFINISSTLHSLDDRGKIIIGQNH